MKEEALKLAEIFEEVGRAKYPYHLDAAEMLRRLVEELDKQGEPVVWANVEEGVISPTFSWKISLTKKEGMIPLYATPQTKPLSDDEIKVLKEIIRISDRKHPLWDKAKEFLK